MDLPAQSPFTATNGNHSPYLALPVGNSTTSTSTEADDSIRLGATAGDVIAGGGGVHNLTGGVDQHQQHITRQGLLEGSITTWGDVREELRWALPCHTYGLACLFLMLSFYTFCSILNLRSQMSARPFMTTINVFLCLLGISRASCFIMDPYRNDQAVPLLLATMMWDAGYPCIVAAFSLVQLAFSRLTQVDFKPKSLLCGSAVRLMIVTHFTFIFSADLITAFHRDLQGVVWGVQTVFIAWGLLLSCAFLYGGAKLMRLLQSLPNSAFAAKTDGEQNKGILQLALLAQCNNIASSVLTAAAPSVLTPKIRITDENERTFSYGSSNSKRSSVQHDNGATEPSSLDTVKSNCKPKPLNRNSNHFRSFEVDDSSSSPKRVATEGECRDNPGPSGITGIRRTDTATSDSSKSRTSSGSSVHQVTSPGITSPLETPLPGRDIEMEETGVFCFDESATDLNNKDKADKMIIPGVEPTGDAYLDEFVIPKIICSIEETLEDDKSLSNKGDLLPEEIPSPKRKKSITWSEDLPNELSNLASEVAETILADDCGGIKSPNLLESDLNKTRVNSSLSCGDHLQRRRRSSTLSTASSRKGSYTSDELLRKGSLSSAASSRRSSSVFESPSRKSSLSSTISSRKGSICGTTMRKGSTASYVSNRKGSSSSVASSRKSSMCSRKGSATWDNQSKGSNISRETQERINRCLDTTDKVSKRVPSPCESPKAKPRPSITPSCRSSRRNTLVNTPNNVELETLVAANASEPPGDLTLSCILNHIAFVNQTEISAKMGARLKESRKEQVKQVLLVTYITALFGALLSLLLLGGVYLSKGTDLPPKHLSPWPWFVYVCCCRVLELAMGCAMANVTRQSVNRHSQYAYPLRMKHGLKMYV